MVLRLNGVLLCSMVLCSALTFPVGQSQALEAVQLYTQDELLGLIQTNSHLKRVKQDDCQLVQDIEARATKMALPAYQFLFGDMLAWRVCVKRDVARGLMFMRRAAEQGLPEALEQLGRYYQKGTLVQADNRIAIIYLREASALGSAKAQLRLVEMLNQDLGSPADFEDAYRWLFHSATADKKLHARIQSSLARLASKMPASVVTRARKIHTNIH